MFLIRSIRSVAIFILFLCSSFQNVQTHAPQPPSTVISSIRHPFPPPTFTTAQDLWQGHKNEFSQNAAAAPSNPFLTDTDNTELNAWDTVLQFFEPDLKTIFGKAGLLELFQTISPESMQQRAQLMTALAAQEEMYNELGTQLLRIKNGQIGLMQLLNRSDRLCDALDGAYYTWLMPLKGYLNRNPRALSLGIGVSWFKAVSYVIGMDLAQHALFGGGLDLEIDATLNGWDTLTALGKKIVGLLTINNPLIRRHMPGYSPAFKTALEANRIAQEKLDAQQNVPLQANGKRQQVLLNAYPITMADMTTALCHHRSLESSWQIGAARVLAAGFIAMLDFNTINTFSAQYSSIKKTEAATRYAHTQLVSLAQLFKAMLELAELCKKNPLLATTAQATSLCEFADAQKRSPKLQKLLDILATTTFSQANAILYNRGKVLAAVQLLQDVREEIIPALNAIGRLDALYAVAHALKNCSSSAPLCIPTFVEQGPTLILEDSWNPCLKPDTVAVVCNNFSFMPNKGRVALFTGPNWSGKSTISRAAPYSILFAGLGIVPARAACMSPFSAIRAYVNPLENIQRGLSTYAAQVLRVQQMRSSLAQLPANRYAFLIFDEPFKGTTHSVMEDMTCALIRELANNSCQLSCIVTHIEKPTLLEPELNGLMHNYFVEVIEQNGDFVRTFRLNRGSAAWWFNDAQAQLRFRAWMSNQLMGNDWV